MNNLHTIQPQIPAEPSQPQASGGSAASLPHSRSPIRFLLLIGASVFAAELLIVVAFLFLPALPPLVEVLLDATALILIVSPVLYWFGFRPFVLEISEHQRAEEELKRLYQGTEQKVVDRTRALALSNEISRRLSGLLDQKQLISEVVEQVRSTFNYYHAHIYLYDPKHEHLVMSGGTGEAARAMLARGHRIEQGRGLVGRAGGTNAPVLVPDVSKDSGWLPNPLLPDTKAEVAVPIAIGGRVLGVLDVQHNVKEGLKQDDVELLQSIAFQVAIALQNARSFEQAQRQADREAFINTVTQRIQNTGDIEGVLQIAARELGQALGAQRATIQVGMTKLTDTRRS
ncbi:MAG: GAF domain-containing protein [Chloroflexota bacterium]